MYKIVTIDKDIVNEIENILTSSAFGWYFQNKTVRPYPKFDTPKSCVDSFQLTHVFKQGPHDIDNNSPYFYLIPKLLKAANLNVKTLFRAKANFNVANVRQKSNQHQAPHTDLFKPDYPNWYTFLYYVNESDGDTLFFDKKFKIIKRVSPQRGKAVLFRNDLLHAAQNPKKNPYRIIINMVVSE
jgi:hypothetical protein